ncbi:hypothetical protein E5676_scaffold248G004830 [Cucumis melo var. makuwa]|uniref:Uncharacterized protein n=1 Tax=Cucumis melo var. makuwa TaxID=1194695 RepID=A0A5A7UNY5_CUCMM|nr:hypothetical protein E6C27_scaffold80G001890 [Cucumis melo var. makuwa]TYJ99271.1 hypothetical protein E5676_scaffold248G004830 [Cucumis melo var. makuwa]
MMPFPQRREQCVRRTFFDAASRVPFSRRGKGTSEVPYCRCGPSVGIDGVGSKTFPTFVCASGISLPTHHC